MKKQKNQDGDRHDATFIFTSDFSLSFAQAMHKIYLPVKVSFVKREWLCNLCLPVQFSLKNQSVILAFLSLTSPCFPALWEVQ